MLMKGDIERRLAKAEADLANFKKEKRAAALTFPSTVAYLEGMIYAYKVVLLLEI